MASFIIRDKATKTKIVETWLKEETLKTKLNTTKYEYLPILDYLYEVNANIKLKTA